MLDPEETLDTAQNDDPRAQIRTFTDEDGVRWKVSEHPFSDYDRRCGNSLIFESEAAVRRIRTFPADWHSLCQSELTKLSWLV